MNENKTKLFQLHMLVVPKIVKLLVSYVDISKLLKKIRLADTWNKPKKVCVLLVIELFYELKGSNDIKINDFDLM